MYYHEDDRAQRLFDVFDVLDGQLNISYVNSTKHIVAWHKHNIKNDYWTCLKGSFKVGLAEELYIHKDMDPTPVGVSVKWEYLSDKNPRVLEITPGIYHGYRALEPGSILCYYLTHKYNPEDEIRAKVGDIGENWNILDK